jgi:hypothetical protein
LRLAAMIVILNRAKAAQAARPMKPVAPVIKTVFGGKRVMRWPDDRSRCA